MAFFDRLERRWGWLAFPGFLRFYALFHILVFVLQIIRPDLGEALKFDRDKIFAGEVWRLATMFFESSQFGSFSIINIIFLIFVVNFVFMINDGLEGAWGPFKASLFYYFGIGTIVFLNFVFPVVVPLSGTFLYFSAFLAFATIYPRAEILLFLLIPIQVRFLAFVQVALLALMVFKAPVLLPYFLVVFLNYFLWAGIPALRGQALVLEAGKRRRTFNSGKMSASEAFHTCAVCQKTDVSDPQAEFRIGADGQEYCSDHLPE